MPTGRPAGRPVNNKPDADAVGLFLVHHLLQLLAGTERWGDRRLDLNYPARLGIAAHARRALAGFEVSEAGDLDLCALLQLSGDDPFIVEQGLDRPAGVSYSGKSEELVRRVRRAVIAKKRVQVFKSHLAARYAGLYSVSTHNGGTVEAEPVDCSEGVIRAVRSDTEVVAVDEVQFLDDGIVVAANDLADRGVRLMLAGIDMDFRGLPFGPMPTLLAVAEIVDKLQAICAACGGPASRNQRLVNGRPALWESPPIMVGGPGAEGARGRHWHKGPRADEDQTALL